MDIAVAEMGDDDDRRARQDACAASVACSMNAGTADTGTAQSVLMPMPAFLLPSETLCRTSHQAARCAPLAATAASSTRPRREPCASTSCECVDERLLARRCRRARRAHARDARSARRAPAGHMLEHDLQLHVVDHLESRERAAARC